MKRNIVFIIGAGASKEVRLPTGEELKERISKLLDIRFEGGFSLISGDYKIMEALRLYVEQPGGKTGDINPYLQESWHIRDALPQATSIDNFIDTQRGNEKLALCGKLGIVRSILKAERESLLYFDQRNPKANIEFNNKNISETWYTSFFQLITENCTKEDLQDRFKRITLIIFNYDRCIEHFVFNALKNYYQIDDSEASELVQLINIYHPYGKVGTLPWSNKKEETVEFGLEPSSKQLLKLADQIRTFTEGTAPDSSEIVDIRKSIGKLEKLVFLGFAFHSLNMDLLFPAEHYKPKISVPKCFATTFGISNSDQKVIKDHIASLYGNNIDINMCEKKCSQFFGEFQRSLGF